MEEAQKKNITSFVLTDINNTSGWYELLQEARKVNIDVKAGIEFRNGNTKLFIGIAKNADGFAELNRYLSYYLKNKLDIPTEAPTFKNVFIIYPYNEDKTYQLNENEYIGVNKNDLTKLRFPKKRQLKDKMVALQTVTFANKKDYNAHRILRAMDKLSIITKLTDEDLAKQNEQFETYDELIKAYDDHAYLLHNAQKLIDQCSFDFTFHTNKNIQLFTGSTKEDINLLLQLTYEGVTYRYGKITKEIQDRINKELDIVIQKGFVSYFLINRDIVLYARNQGFYTIGRGSGANSLIAYCLRITDVDPLELDLYFERFINLFRETPPDFDLDFSWKDRDDVTHYIFDKYGEEHTSLLATYTTFKDRSFIREVAKTFGLPDHEIAAMVKKIW